MSQDVFLVRLVLIFLLGRCVMRFFKRNFFTLCCLILLIAMGFCGEAWATSATSKGGSSLMSSAQEKTRNVFTNVRTITFILGGFGLVGIAFQAIMGKVKWTWFAGLAVGLAILGAAGSIVEYATGDSTAAIETTFGQI